MKKAVVIVVLGLLAVGATVIGQDWRLFVRYLQSPEDVSHPSAALWFEPRQAIGEGEGTPIPTASPPVLSQSALDAAWQYAEEMGTHAFIVAYNGQIQLERYGEGFDAGTYYQSQSLHKGLTAMGLGAAIASGAIPSMDEPAANYIPEWVDDPDRVGITLADLAYMQGGLERARFANHPFNPGAQLFLSGRLRKRVNATPIVALPGERYIWSNASTQAMALAIEAAVEMPWAEFIRQHIWGPMGGGEAYVQLDRPGGSAQAFCCLVSNARNWLRVGELLRNDGVIEERRILPAGWVTKMSTGGETNPNYGMQLWANEPYTGEFLVSAQPPMARKRSGRLMARDAFYIEGHFAQRLHIVPSSKLVVVRFGDDRLDWDDAQLMNPLIAATQEMAAAVNLPQVPPIDHSFGERDHPPAPDYGKLIHWAAHPNKQDVADIDPLGTAPTDPPADGFYINPTTYAGPTWNADVNDFMANVGVDDVVLGQGTVLADCCRIFSPRYRQAGSGSVADFANNGIKAFDFAYQDVREAFRVFVEQSDRPIVLIGHSQGGFHLQRLLIDEVVGTPLADRLVAAYVVGIPIPEAQFEGPLNELSPCTDADQTGCVASWLTFGPNADAEAFHAGLKQRFAALLDSEGNVPIVCTNPLTGGPSAAEADKNLGAIVLPPTGGYVGEPLPGLVGARCDEGMLFVEGNPGAAFSPRLLPVDNYHYYDIALFYSNIRADATNRVRRWIDGQ